MRIVAWLTRRERQLALVMGVSDGILLALTLTAGRLVDGQTVGLRLAVGVGLGSFVSGAFVFFVARYAELMRDLVRQGHQLNMPPTRQLSRTRLGRSARWDALAQTAVASTSSFLGAVAPLLLATLRPHPPWLAILVPICFLGVLGLFLARVTSQAAVPWVLGLMLGGAAISAIGTYLRLV
jgi:VIT1/CCC1 family predicted Fe2+/Mn2+ transporter